jgi:hypothetical protein
MHSLYTVLGFDESHAGLVGCIFVSIQFVAYISGRYSYCTRTHTVLIMYSYCTRTVLVLYLYCVPTILILHCTHTVQGVHLACRLLQCDSYHGLHLLRVLLLRRGAAAADSVQRSGESTVPAVLRYHLQKVLSALCSMLHALCSMRCALCSLLHALCSRHVQCSYGMHSAHTACTAPRPVLTHHALQQARL